MKKIILSQFLLCSLFVAGCTGKEQTEVDKVEESNTEQVNSVETESVDADTNVENNDEQEKEEIDMGSNKEYVKQVEQNAKSLESVKEVTKENYKYIQKVNEKINKLEDKSIVSSDLQNHISTLNEEANNFEKEILNKAEETVAHAFLEQALGLYGITLDSKVAANIVFDKAELEVNNKKFECEVAEQRVTLKRKVLAQPATEAKLQLYNNDKLIKTILIEVQGI